METATSTQTTEQTNQTLRQETPAVTQIVGDSLWGISDSPYQPAAPASQPPTPVTEPPAAAITAPAVDPAPGAAPGADAPAAPADEAAKVDEYFKTKYGMDKAAFEAKWDELNKPKEPEEVRWSYDDTREDELFDYLQRKKQLERLEQLEVTDANQAAEIIRANLQLKHKELSPENIERLMARQYAIPPRPTQAFDQSAEDFAAEIAEWEVVVKEKHQDMIIDAKIAKPELINYKGQITVPDVPRVQSQQPVPDQKALAEMEAGREAYLSALEAGYQNFNGFSVTAKDGDVQLPITYKISPDDQVSTKNRLQNFNLESYFDKRWFDEKGVPKVSVMQEDLYLIENRDKIFQSIANESAAKRYEEHLRAQNNIKLTGVQPTLSPNQPGAPVAKSASETMQENIWAL